MKKFHGTPITPQLIFNQHLEDKNVLISFLRPENLRQAVKLCQGIMIDNGAFSYFRKQIKPDWSKFYSFIGLMPESPPKITTCFCNVDFIRFSERKNLSYQTSIYDYLEAG